MRKDLVIRGSLSGKIGEMSGHRAFNFLDPYPTLIILNRDIGCQPASKVASIDSENARTSIITNAYLSIVRRHV